MLAENAYPSRGQPIRPCNDAESADGTHGAVYYFNDGEDIVIGTPPAVGDVLEVSGGLSVHTITYSAQVTARGDATNDATVTSGEDRDSDSATVAVTYPLPVRLFLPLIMNSQ